MNVHLVNRDIDLLTYTMRCAWLELNARCVEQRVWLVLLETLRSHERASWLVEQGKSWSTKSYHTPGPDGKAAALDAAPIVGVKGSVLQRINWDPTHRHWQTYVQVASDLGLECGAEWKQQDWSHVQLQRRR